MMVKDVTACALCVFIASCNQPSAGANVLLSELEPPKGAVGGFGATIALSGRTALVAAGDSLQRRQFGDEIYVFDVVTGKLLNSLTVAGGGAVPEGFGFSLDTDGDRAIVGTVDEDGGSAYVYDVVSGEQLWQLEPDDRSNGQTNDRQTSILYDARTGEVAIDVPRGIELTSINIDSANGIFTGDPAQHILGGFDNDSDHNIFHATFGENFGTLSFGNVAQPGLSKDYILSDLTVIGSSTGRGSALGDVDLIYVPEPASIVLLTVAALALLSLRLRLRGQRGDSTRYLSGAPKAT